MIDKIDRVKMLAGAVALELSASETAALAEPLCGLVDVVDQACADFAVEAPEPYSPAGKTGERR